MAACGHGSMGGVSWQNEHLSADYFSPLLRQYLFTNQIVKSQESDMNELFIYRILFLQKNWKLGLEIDVNELSACKLEAQDQVKMKKFVVFYN